MIIRNNVIQAIVNRKTLELEREAISLFDYIKLNGCKSARIKRRLYNLEGKTKLMKEIVDELENSNDYVTVSIEELIGVMKRMAERTSS